MDSTPVVVRNGNEADGPQVYVQDTQTWAQGHNNGGLYNGVQYSSSSKATTPQPNDASKLRCTNRLLGIALAMVVIAAAVGGGVGGGLAVQRARDSCSSTPETTVSATTGAKSTSATTVSAPTSANSYTANPTNFMMPLSPNAIVSLANPSQACPTDIFQDSRNLTAAFKTFCQQNYVGSDITDVITYTFADCLDACLNYNQLPGKDICVGVSMGVNIQDQVINNHGGNCWLKKLPLPPLGPESRAWSAVLCKDRDCQRTY